MDTTDAPPPPPPRPTTPAGQIGPTAAWWRQPVADLLDVLLVALVGGLLGGAVAGAMLAGSSDDPWAELGALLLGLGAGLLAAFVAWIVLLAKVSRGSGTPGMRAVGPPASSALATAGRHVAVVVVLWSAAGTVAAAAEPWPAGPLGGGLLAAVAAAVALAAWGRGPLTSHVRTVGIVAIAGLLVTGAVPDRAPYPWELRQEAQAAVLTALADDPAARRVCGSSGAAAGPVASHATEPCYDPDREWLVDRNPAVVAEQLAGITADVAGPHASVRLHDTSFGREVRLGDIAVATVAEDLDGCASLVAIGAGPPAPRSDQRCH